MDINLVKTSVLCRTWGCYMLIHLTLTATILGETYYYLYFEKNGAQTARKWESKPDSNPNESASELLAEWALYWQGLVLSSFVELIYDFFCYQKLKLFVFHSHGFVRKHFTGPLLFEEYAALYKLFRKHSASRTEDHLTELCGRLSQWENSSAHSPSNVVHIYHNKNSQRAAADCRGGGFGSPGSDIKHGELVTHTCTAPGPPHLHINSHFPVETLSPWWHHAASSTAPDEVRAGQAGAGRWCQRWLCGAGGTCGHYAVFRDMGCHIEITKSSVYKCLTWRLKSGCCHNPSHSNVGNPALASSILHQQHR